MTTKHALKQCWAILGKPNLTKEDINFVRNQIDNAIISLSDDKSEYKEYSSTITNSKENEIAYQQGF